MTVPMFQAPPRLLVPAPAPQPSCPPTECRVPDEDGGTDAAGEAAGAAEASTTCGLRADDAAAGSD